MGSGGRARFSICRSEPVFSSMSTLCQETMAGQPLYNGCHAVEQVCFEMYGGERFLLLLLPDCQLGNMTPFCTSFFINVGLVRRGWDR